MGKRLIKLGVVAGLLAGVVSVIPNPLQAYVGCWTYDGKACTTPTYTFVCYNQYPNEPGICYCTDEGRWECS